MTAVASTIVVTSSSNNTTNYTGNDGVTVFLINSSIDSFTNSGIVLGGGGASPGTNTTYRRGNAGAHGLVVTGGTVVNTVSNTGCLAGGGGSGATFFSSRGGKGGAGGGGGGASQYPNHGGYGGDAQSDGGAPGGGGGFGRLGNTGGGNGGSNTNFANNLLGGIGQNGTSNGGGGAGGGHGSNSSYGGGGGGSGGGIGAGNGSAAGGNGGFGLVNSGTISNLTNAQGCSSGFGPLYLYGNAPTNYNILISSPTTYGQLYASPGTSVFPITGTVVFGIDPTSVLESRTYYGVLVRVTPSNFSGSLDATRSWTLVQNTTFSYAYDLVVTVVLPTPTLSNFSIPQSNYGDAPFTITPPTSNSTGAFSYTSSDTSVATISGNTVTIVGKGSSTITATQAPDNNYSSETIQTTLQVFDFRKINTVFNC